MRRSSLVAVLSLLLTAGVLAVAPAALAKIVIGQGIAGVKLGDSETQVEGVLGSPTLKQPSSYNGSVEWNYGKPPLLGAMSFVKGDLTGLWTSSKQQKTGKGIGPGSSLSSTERAYPAAKCSTGPFGPKSVICVIKSRPSGRTVETAFLFYTRSMGAREVDISFT